jgi:hypothetical protein
MNITGEHQEQVKAWLEKRASSGLRCFVCGNQNWVLGELAAMTASIDLQTSRIHYMQGYALVPLICNVCAHTIWFNATRMGLQPKPADDAA